MTKDEMKALMQRDADDHTAWVHNPLSMETSDAALWVSISFESLAEWAHHMAEHMAEIGESEACREELVPAVMEETSMFMMVAHNCIQVLSAKLSTAEQRLEVVRRKIERETGQPIKSVRWVGGEGVSGLLIEADNPQIPDDLSEMNKDE